MNEAAMVAIWLHWHRWAQQQLVVLHWGYAYFGCIIDDVHILLVFVLASGDHVHSSLQHNRKVQIGRQMFLYHCGRTQ